MSEASTILVVDDTPDYLGLLVKTLTQAGYRALGADGGEAALELVAAEPPDLILLDVRMPGIDGFEVCRRLKACPESRDIPVLFTSAFSEQEEQAEGFRAGGLDFISKPFRREELLARVRTHLALRRERAEQAEELRGAYAWLQRAARASAALARRQAAVAELGQMALASGEVGPLLDRAVQRVAEVLGLEFCKVLELLPGGEALLLRAGVGWKEGLVGAAIVDAGADSQAGFTLLSKEPVVVTDLRSEQRFSGPPLLHEHGVVSGLSTVIGDVEHPFGVLGAHSPREVAFSRQDVDFLRAVANVLGSAIQRFQVEKERSLLDARLRQQQKLESIGTLASGVAHEINNPINGVINYAQLILDGVDEESPFREYAGEIVREAERVALIVRNLLQFARVDKQSHSPARVTDIVSQTLSLIRTVMRHDQIVLEVDVPEDLPPVLCRTQQIQQVLMNLLTNARDALNARYPGYHEGKRISVVAGTLQADGRPWVRITVEDFGGGIAREAQARIFDPFFTTKPRDVGTGLGLSISHAIAKEHRGELFFETEPGEWTRFHLDLPVDNGWKLGAEG